MVDGFAIVFYGIVTFGVTPGGGWWVSHCLLFVLWRLWSPREKEDYIIIVYYLCFNIWENQRSGWRDCHCFLCIVALISTRGEVDEFVIAFYFCFDICGHPKKWLIHVIVIVFCLCCGALEKTEKWLIVDHHYFFFFAVQIKYAILYVRMS